MIKEPVNQQFQLESGHRGIVKNVFWAQSSIICEKVGGGVSLRLSCYSHGNGPRQLCDRFDFALLAI